jgi:hypothetical protein
MKFFLITLITILLFSTQCFSQSCSGGPPITCSNEKVISPAVKQPTGVGLLSSTCSSMVVKWTGSAGQEYSVNAVYKNAVTNKTDSISAGSITCDGSNNCKATIPVTAGVQYTISVQAKQLMGQCFFYSYAANLSLPYATAACNGAGQTVTFSGKVLLQGAYNTATGKMNNDLNALGILQASAIRQPYSAAAFGYTGTEAVGAGFFAAHPAIVDWVLIELRNPNAPASIVARRAAFVTQDGAIVETDGSKAQITFAGVAPGWYHVVVRHRNHLSIRTVEAVDFSSGAGSYDFTTANFKSFKNQPYPSTVQVGTVWCMRGGNAVASTVVKYSGTGSAYNQILFTRLGGSFSRVLNNVYVPEDVNMNGTVKWNGPANEQDFLLNKVLSGSASAQLVEQQ